MRLLTSLALAALAFTATNAEATAQWTGCVTVTGVSNYIPGSQAIILAVSPAVSGCTSSVNGVTGAITFQVSQFGVTAGDLSAILASSLAAYASERSVTLYYDNASGCFGKFIANGGYSGACP